MCQLNMILVTFGHWNHDGILINLVIQLLGCGVIYKELWGGSYVEVNKRKKKKGNFALITRMVVVTVLFVYRWPLKILWELQYLIGSLPLCLGILLFLKEDIDKIR